MEKNLCEIYDIVNETRGKPRKVEVTIIKTLKELENAPEGAILQFQNGILGILEKKINRELVINYQEGYQKIIIFKVPISKIEILTNLNNWLYFDPKLDIQEEHLTNDEEYFKRKKILEERGLWEE